VVEVEASPRAMSQKLGKRASAGIAKAYGSYEDLLADDEKKPSIIRCRTTCHVPGPAKRRGRQACPLRKADRLSTAREAQSLIAVRDQTGVKIQEAFMVRTIPNGWACAN